jgi:Tfp pilus assembly protein PilP
MALSPTLPRRLVSSVLVPTALLTLASCASSPAPTVVARAAAPVHEPSEEEAPVDRVVDGLAPYDPTGRDPFRSYLDADERVVEEDAPALARFALGTLKVIGVVSGVATPMAMITTPEGKGYRVRIGDRIGHHEGRVHAIRRDAVIVAETFYDPILGRRQLLQTLNLRDVPVLPPAEALKAYE